MYLNRTDSALVEASLATQDPKPFGELVRRHQSSVRAFLRHLNPADAAGADDLAQDTFILAHRTLERFQRDGRFETWLLGLAYNLHRNAAKRARRRETAPLDGSEPAEEASPGELVERKEDLAYALAQLEPEEQILIHACYTQSLSHSEAATILQIPLGTVKTQLARAKDKLRTLLAVWNLNT